MKAAVLTDYRTLVIREIEKPKPGPDEVLVRVAYTGVCGSDVPRVLNGAVHSYPIVLGHEFSGRIETLGENVNPALAGARVAGVPLRPCMECDSCRRGNYSLCSQYGFIGSRQNGSMAEYVCVPAKNVFPISDGVSDLEGAFFEPITVALHAIEMMDVTPGASVLILGGGTIGILVAQALRDYSPDVVVVTCRNSGRLPTMKSIGLNCVFATDEFDWKKKALKYASGFGFDYVFDAAGTPETILQAFELSGPRGTICFIGTPKDDVTFSVRQWEYINRKELLVRGSWMSYSNPWPGVEWEKACDLISRGVISVTEDMVDSVFDLDDAMAAFHRIEIGEVRGKVMIRS